MNTSFGGKPTAKEIRPGSSQTDDEDYNERMKGIQEVNELSASKKKKRNSKLQESATSSSCCKGCTIF